MREHSAKSAESEYVRIMWACTFTDNYTAKYTENLAHEHAVDTRPGNEASIRQASKLAEESLVYSSLRPQQEKIVSTFVQGNDAIK